MNNQYDQIARKYHDEISQDMKVKDEKGREKLKVEMIDRPHIKKATDWRILDIGCGSGIHINFFLENFPDIQSIVGIDSSSEMIKIAKENNNSPKANYLVSDMDHLPFENNSFDFVFSRNAIHYSQNLSKTFCEIARVMKPNAKFFFQVSNPIHNLFLKKSKNYTKKEKISFTIQGGDATVFHSTFTYEEYINSIIENHLNIIEIHEYFGRTSKIDGYEVPVVLSFLLKKYKI